MANLNLPLNGEYFHQIKEGSKLLEYREIKPYWTKRIVGREYENIILTLGYPEKDDDSKRIKRPWRGYKIIKGLIHPHFKNVPTDVYAIRVN